MLYHEHQQVATKTLRPPEAGQLRSTLSDFYPAGTIYFYSFPSGEDSNFYNQVPAWKEELVAARPLICAGEKIKVVTFSSSLEADTWELLTQKLETQVLDKRKIFTLPSDITAKVGGAERNKKIKSALKEFISRGELVMAQPYLNGDISEIFQLDPQLSIRLNDKLHKNLYIPEDYLPKRFHTFQNGREFKLDTSATSPPCVVKVTSSSSGDGVRICRTVVDLLEAKNDFQEIMGTVLVEEYIPAAYNIGVQFGIPHDPRKNIEIIGWGEQLITDQGDYLGGIVNPKKRILSLEKIYSVLRSTILPRVRKMGWYGVGGIDVLIREDGQFYFIDPNFRMTAAFAYIFLAKNNLLKTPLVSFTGTFRGTKEDFEKLIVPFANDDSPFQKLKIITLAKNNGLYHFNAGMFFEREGDIKRNAAQLRKLGLESAVLSRLASSNFRYQVY